MIFYKMFFRHPKTVFWSLLILAPVLFALIPLGITAFSLTSGFTRAPFTNPGSDTVNGYYTALKNQDYAQAYTYIDHNQQYASIFPNVESSGSPQENVNLSSLTEAAKNMDRQEGTLTDYQIPNMSWGDTSGSYAVTVTRNGKSSYYILEARLEGAQWKITSISRFPYPMSTSDINE